MARPRKRLDLDRLRALATIGLNNVEIGEAMDVSHDTLSRRYRKLIAEARGNAKQKILAKAYQMAIAGNVRCLELCLINRAGWALRPETIVNVNTIQAAPVQMPSREELKARLAAVDRFLADEGKSNGHRRTL